MYVLCPLSLRPGAQHRRQAAPLCLAPHEGTWGSAVSWNILTGARGHPSLLASMQRADPQTQLISSLMSPPESCGLVGGAARTLAGRGPGFLSPLGP